MKHTLYLIFSVFTVICLLSILPVHGEDAVYDNVLRLHVLPNSDAQDDQALKLSVRDGVLAEVSCILDGCESFDEANARLTASLGRVRSAAEDIVAREGYDYPVEVSLGREEYPTKDYESFCFPSGEYTSLRVMIGESGGKNWWCVLFPELCLGAASDTSDKFISAGFTPDQYKIVTESDDGEYEVRFKLLEVLEEIVS